MTRWKVTVLAPPVLHMFPITVNFTVNSVLTWEIDVNWRSAILGLLEIRTTHYNGLK